MNQEIKRQATRLGLIFARYGITLSRAEKLTLMAEIQGDKSWAVTASAGKPSDSSVPVTNSETRTPLTPLQLLAAQEYGFGDYTFYRYREDVHPGDDTLFEYVLKEALEAREDVDGFLSMMETAKSDLQQVIDNVEKHQEETRTSDVYIPCLIEESEQLPQTAATFSAAEVGVRHMAKLFGPDGKRDEDAGEGLTKTFDALEQDVAMADMLRATATQADAVVASYEGQFGLLLEQQLSRLRADSEQHHESARARALEVCRVVEDKWPGSVAGLAMDFRGTPKDFGWYEDAWVFIPASRQMADAAHEVRETLAQLAGNIAKQ